MKKFKIICVKTNKFYILEEDEEKFTFTFDNYRKHNIYKDNSKNDKCYMNLNTIDKVRNKIKNKEFICEILGN